MKATLPNLMLSPSQQRFNQLVKSWVHQMRTGHHGRVYSEATIKGYLYAFGLMAKALNAPLSLYVWDVKLLKRTMAYLKPSATQCHHSQRAECHNAFASFTKWLIATGVRPNHFRTVLQLVRENRPKRYTVARRDKPPCSALHAQIEALLNAGLPRLAVASALAFYAGLRRCEIASLKRADLSPCLSHFYVVGKGQKRRLVPILPQLKQWLALSLSQWPEVETVAGFCSKTALDSACSRANKLGFSFAFHGSRRRFGTTLSQQNVPIDHIRRVLGHQSLTTTLLYIESDDEAIRQHFAASNGIIF